MPVVTAALTFGSFGDILEAARIAKRIVDVLRKGPGGSPRREELIATLKGMCEDMSKLTLVFDGDHFTERLWAEVDLCRSLLDEFSAKINSYEAAGLRGLLRKSWMVAVEEKELASWKAQISDRRAALHALLSSFNSIQLHEVGEQLGRVGSQVQYIGSRVDGVEARVKMVLSDFLAAQVTQTGSEIREAVSEMRQAGTEVQRRIAQMSLHGVLDPVFFVVDPLGRPITVQLSHCHSFHDLDRILKAYLFNHPDAGSQYVSRGDYNIISTEGEVIPRSNLRRKVGAWMQFDMSIVKRAPDWTRPQLQAAQQTTCPQCGQASAEATEGSWVNCTERTCGTRYQISLQWVETATASTIEEIASPQISGEETQAEIFRLIQIVYETLVSFLVE
ncbi:hypothetical protein C8F04DRAFT_1154853 [Mycena alexandri]|uniref:Ubiquitin-like domain-containing protein n=1 Tax=Mycena alexandri TaxID=1745969 RepID=A0AAD6RZZ7_9AGAR|nr:hypothetical protein C8F04DRAFT_1154853 [Mycena alexandri]